MRYAEGPTAEATIHVSAPPEVLWTLVSDIHLVASLSREVQEVAWLDDVREPAVGAAFKGRSRHPQVGEWTTMSRVVACDPPRVFAWAVENPDDPAAVWRFELTPHEGGTELRAVGADGAGVLPALHGDRGDAGQGGAHRRGAAAGVAGRDRGEPRRVEGAGRGPARE